MHDAARGPAGQDAGEGAREEERRRPGWRALLDHLVGAHQECFRDGQADGLGGLEVDDQLESGWLLHRQVGRFFTLEDAVDVAGSVTNLIAMLIFAIRGIIDWRLGIPMLLCAIVGGYIGANLVKSLNEEKARRVILVYAWGITLWLIARAYLL